MLWSSRKKNAFWLLTKAKIKAGVRTKDGGAKWLATPLHRCVLCNYRTGESASLGPTLRKMDKWTDSRVVGRNGRCTYHLHIGGYSGEEVQQLVVVNVVWVSQLLREFIHPWKLGRHSSITPQWGGTSALQQCVKRGCLLLQQHRIKRLSETPFSK